MKKVAVAIAGVVLLLAAALVWERWDEQKNRGRLWGYWGEYNRVAKALSDLPGVTVAERWCNADTLVIEEFGFHVIADGQPIKLFFGEKDPVRRLRSDSLSRALTDRIKKEAANQPVQINAVDAPRNSRAVTANSRSPRRV